MDITKLTSHQVFQQIQTVNSDHPIGQGTTIFANSFTGAPVDMDQRVRDVLTSESIFIGNNPIVQLQKALERLEGGPWFIDCRGDVLYIHNKPLSIPVVHNYVYGHENGEVLAISFKTQYRTKNATRGATMSFDGFKKTMSTTATGLQIGTEQEIEELAAQNSGPLLTSGSSPSYLDPNIEPERNYWERQRYVSGNTPEVIQAKSDQEYKKVVQEDYQQTVQNNPEVHTNYVQNLLTSKNMGRGTEGEKRFREQFQEVENDPAKVKDLIQEYFGSDQIMIDNGTYRPIVETRNVTDIIGNGDVYIPAYSRSHTKLGASYIYRNGGASHIDNGDFAYSLEQFLKGKGYVLVSSPKYTESYGRHSDAKVQIVHKAKSMYPISAVQLMTDYYSRAMNSPERAYMKYLLNNAMGNRAKKITEKRLEVEMRVVGRPSLTSSSKIHIENVGYRSGDYHIKTCIHRLSSDGYTCSLTLVQGSHKVASETNSAELSMGSPKPTKRAADGGTEQPTKNGKVQIDLSMLTQDEMEYFNSKYGDMNEQTNIAIEVAYNLYLRAQDKPGARKNGVYHKHVEMQGNQVTKVWYTSTLPQHGSDYETFKTAYSSKFYDIIRRKVETYIRYKRNGR